MKLDYLKNIGSLLREALTENGKGRYSRLTGATIVLFTLSWVTYLVLRNKGLFPI